MEQTLRIALFGYGKMGKLVEKTAKERGHQIAAIIDPRHSDKEINEMSLREADICIDFTHPSAVLDNIRRALDLGKSVVVGTTGWEEHLPDVKNWVEMSGAGLFHAPNFSCGVYFFQKIVAEAVKIVMTNGRYSLAGFEAHHNQKADAPSGTAKALAKAIAETLRCPPEEIPFSSLRCGSIPGTHSIFFDSPEDTITLTHQARNREGFALGALEAAEWLKGKQGVFTLGNLLNL